MKIAIKNIYRQAFMLGIGFERCLDLDEWSFEIYLAFWIIDIHNRRI